MEIDLEKLSLKELKGLQTRVSKEIANFESRKKREALSELEEKAKELGFSLSELTGATTIRKRAPAVPKYANPDAPSETWSGRGRKPHWFSAALAVGRTPEDLSI
ncbi:MAG: H-NS histone family protein [Pseudorhodobacter sp.]